MSELVKKRPTETVCLSFTGPAERAEEASRIMEVLGFVRPAPHTEEDSIPWREALQVKDDELPATYLRGARYREDMTQAQLSEKTGIPIRHISEMENGKRPIGQKNARLLGDALSIDPRMLRAR